MATTMRAMAATIRAIEAFVNSATIFFSGPMAVFYLWTVLGEIAEISWALIMSPCFINLPDERADRVVYHNYVLPLSTAGELQY